MSISNGVSIQPLDLEPPFEQCLTSFGERTIVNNIIHHPLANDIPAWSPGGGWHQPDIDHLLRPFSVVITSSTGRAEVVLPYVNHFVAQRLEYFSDRKVGEVVNGHLF